MSEGTADANGVRLWYETFGAGTDPAVLLIMGLGAQAIAWHTDFCTRLAGHGFFVIRFDNRDVGLSQWLDDSPEPYSLAAMAADAVALLDALGIARAHIVGASMGGMIAQVVALDHPDRTLTLTSIMSTPGGPAEPPSDEWLANAMQPPGRTRDERIAAAVKQRRLLAAGAFPQDDEYRAAMAAAAVDRAFHPAGTMRQAYAIATAPSRRERLGELSVPALVIHGTADPLVRYGDGVATAKAIPGATLHTIDGLGHELPPSVWDEVIAVIVRHIGPTQEVRQVRRTEP
jgi:pimeloyl-ACP methyl ester carboxylesterase